MYILMVVVFILGYLAIALEHPLKIDKAASALLIGAITWSILALAGESVLENSVEYMEFLAANPAEGHNDMVANHFITESLLHHLSEIASILFFLLGAMTIVELIDAHEGFAIITDRINTANKVKLMWILSVLTFFLSAALDNLTTSIVMAALLKKLVKGKEDLWLFAGMIILAANAGGAWSPIGDVTTIMLWIGGQVTAANIVLKLILPSLICLIVPLIILTFTMKGEVERKLGMVDKAHLIDRTTPFEQNLVFFLGVGSLLFVPIFKTVTHLPPFMGILFGLGVLWTVTEILHRSKNHTDRSKLSVIGVLQKVDTPSVLFFLGILAAVASLQTAGHLRFLASFLESSIGDMYAINMVIGLLSSIVDNVPLVAGAMGMYDLLPVGAEAIAGQAYPVDHAFWEFLAYCAGTGGSCLIIGSAAGVAVMGILQVDFIWYMKNISWLAFVGYIAGAFTYILMDYALF
ncbi:MAG: sodium:proton antiporter NhaD [Flavobacteriales bacterium]|jgi:Na+/H+ antiporter NhaD/arsenite permease-like protein|nr:sodium:proton antiporter NhaD [Flavobacteriales bacterium]MBT3964435.1 sodium:proton antiporter NhaD [Flavobacteriales bacterium]MBT4705098.1 sodium:proton antiporter NhaD [Flavobacteriales bacterium]MBT4930118.1 sodium:proton antiporter NhaD [Flavobacteriales bacterium]MBT5133076.1 sodium:proton antiporter NhaD [Flavobacteriales bacterium]